LAGTAIDSDAALQALMRNYKCSLYGLIGAISTQRVYRLW